MSAIDVQTLIQDVFERPPIWNGMTGDKDPLWNEISIKHIHKPIRSLKTKWENLRRSFRNQLKNIPRNPDNSFTVNPHFLTSNWPYYRDMLFLVNHLRLAPIKQKVLIKTENIEVSPPLGRKRRNADAFVEPNEHSKKKRNVEESLSTNGKPTGLVVQTEIEKSENETDTSSLNGEDNSDSGRRCDSDRLYLKSLLLYFEQLDLPRKLNVRAKIELILKEEVNNM